MLEQVGGFEMLTQQFKSADRLTPRVDIVGDYGLDVGAVEEVMRGTAVSMFDRMTTPWSELGIDSLGPALAVARPETAALVQVDS